MRLGAARPSQSVKMAKAVPEIGRNSRRSSERRDRGSPDNSDERVWKTSSPRCSGGQTDIFQECSCQPGLRKGRCIIDDKEERQTFDKLAKQRKKIKIKMDEMVLKAEKHLVDTRSKPKREAYMCRAAEKLDKISRKLSNI